jgi:hypothetical protein
MSSEGATAPQRGIAPAVEGSRRAAFRLAFGVTVCFAVVETLGWDATFMAPLLAATMLAKPRSPGLGEGIGIIAVIALSTHAILVLTTALIGNPTVLILALTLVLYLSFYAHRRGVSELVTLLFQVSAVALPTIAVVSPSGAGTFATTLISAGVVALITVWVAHAAFPVPAAAVTDAAPPGSSRSVEPSTASRQALFDTLVLIPVVTWYILDATQVAVVVLIIIVTLLRQHDPQHGQRAALGVILGNLLGGIAAVIAYNLILLSNTLPFFITVCLAASLIFAGRIATAGARAPLYALAYSTFILLLGMGLTPLPGGSGEAFASRLFYVLLASAYAIGGVSLVERRRK